MWRAVTVVKYRISTDISISVHRVNKWWGNRSGSINLSVLPCVPCHKRSVFALHGWFALWALCKNWGGQLENWSRPKLGLQVRVNMVMSDFTEDVRSVQCNVDCRRFKFVSSVRSSSVYPCLLHVHTQQATIPIFSNSSKIPHVLYFWKAGDSRNSIMIIISSYQFDGAYRCPMDGITISTVLWAIIFWRDRESYRSQAGSNPSPVPQTRLSRWHFNKYIWLLLKMTQSYFLVDT